MGRKVVARVPAPTPRRLPPAGRIVAEVDGSPAAVAARRWATEKTSRREAPLLAVVAFRQELPTLPPFGPAAEAAAITRDTPARAIRDADVRHVEALVVEGQPPTRLLELARDADLLVVPTRPGRTRPCSVWR